MSNDAGLAALAFNRFGLGARPGDLDGVRSDPRDLVLDEIKRRAVPLPTGSDLLDTPAALEAFRQQRVQRRAARARDRSNPVAPSSGSMPPAIDAAASIMPREAPARRQEPSRARRLYQTEAMARISLIVDAPLGFAERLVWFWANHFAVSTAKGGVVRTLAGAFEREAIRPYVFGRFADMLIAVETHPAMLIYLDNQRSIGPDSLAGRRRKRGINENLAREIMELHTLGVDGGYRQADVASLARILTGWTVAGQNSGLGLSGTFLFNPAWHEPGAGTILGRTYPDIGVDQGRAALLDLARHSETARHMAFKLARHFVADEPPPSLVASLAKVFEDTDGDLAAVSTALVGAEEAWGGSFESCVAHASSSRPGFALAA